jgi:hypothetical protein
MLMPHSPKGDVRGILTMTNDINEDFIKMKQERDILKEILSLIASGAIVGTDCRAIANTTLNELYQPKGSGHE